MTEAQTPDVVIRPMQPGSPAIEICAEWRHRAWFQLEGFSLDQTIQQLRDFIEQRTLGPDATEAALVAEINGEPVGTCLLIEHEYEPKHNLSPWLAGLFVNPDARGKGIGGQLVKAVEQRAMRHQVKRLHLYTTDRRGFYEGLGWLLAEEFDWDGVEACLMIRGFNSAGNLNSGQDISPS